MTERLIWLGAVVVFAAVGLLLLYGEWRAWRRQR